MATRCPCQGALPPPAMAFFLFWVFFYFLFLVRTDWLVYLGWRSREPKRGTHVYYQTGTDCLPACVICLSGCRWLSGGNRREEKNRRAGGLASGIYSRPWCVSAGRYEIESEGYLFLFVLFFFGSFFGCPFASHSTHRGPIGDSSGLGWLFWSGADVNLYLSPCSLPPWLTYWVVSVCVC